MRAPRTPQSGAILTREAPVLVLLVGLIVYFSLRAPGFVEAQGLVDCARQYASYAILAAGLTLVIGSGGIDISVGSVLGFSAVVLGIALTKTEMPLVCACLLSIGSGTTFGVLNGVGVAVIGLQPVVVTLSTMAAARGLAYVIAGQGVSSISLPDRAQWLQNASYSTPAPLVLALLVGAAGAVTLSRTVFGRALLAIGGNEKAARLSGIRVPRVKLLVYAITGALSGIAGVMTAGLMSTATTDAGTGYEFEAITAVLMGGTSIAGGEATVVGSLLGVTAAAVLNRGFGLMGITDHWRMMFLGLILIASVLLDRARGYAAHRGTTGEPMK